MPTRKPYTPPVIVEYGDATALTADSRNDNSADVFFSLNGPEPGLGGSSDTCVTEDGVNCL
jgi:hypothetical protein